MHERHAKRSTTKTRACYISTDQSSISITLAGPTRERCRMYLWYKNWEGLRLFWKPTREDWSSWSFVFYLINFLLQMCTWFFWKMFPYQSLTRGNGGNMVTAYHSSLHFWFHFYLRGPSLESETASGCMLTVELAVCQYKLLDTSGHVQCVYILFSMCAIIYIYMLLTWYCVSPDIPKCKTSSRNPTAKRGQVASY